MKHRRVVIEMPTVISAVDYVPYTDLFFYGLYIHSIYRYISLQVLRYEDHFIATITFAFSLIGLFDETTDVVVDWTPIAQDQLVEATTLVACIPAALSFHGYASVNVTDEAGNC